MIDKALVEACYRAILGRDPESEAVVADKIKWLASPEDLIRDLMGSEEFPNRAKQIQESYLAPPAARIDLDVSRDRMQALFRRLQSQWRALGEREPFWSVLALDAYRSERLDERTLENFYATGAHHADLIDRFCARNGVRRPGGICLEFGAGVGRVTRSLAARFDKVIAVDISEGNQRRSMAMAEQAGLNAIEHVLLDSPEQVERLPPCDVIFSLMVLQHNPPPIQKYQLDVILSKLNPGGVFLYQTQCFYPGYVFDVDRYLNSSVETMDMHSLPMHVSLELIEKHGLHLREVAADLHTGRFGSYSFFGFAAP